jgi:hypothetical protein
MDVAARLSRESIASPFDVRVAVDLAQLLEAEAVPPQVISDPRLIGEALVREVRAPVSRSDRTPQLLGQSRLSSPNGNILNQRIYRRRRTLLEGQRKPLTCGSSDRGIASSLGH